MRPIPSQLLYITVYMGFGDGNQCLTRSWAERGLPATLVCQRPGISLAPLRRIAARRRSRR